MSVDTGHFSHSLLTVKKRRSAFFEMGRSPAKIKSPFSHILYDTHERHFFIPLLTVKKRRSAFLRIFGCDIRMHSSRDIFVKVVGRSLSWFHRPFPKRHFSFFYCKKRMRKVPHFQTLSGKHSVKSTHKKRDGYGEFFILFLLVDSYSQKEGWLSLCLVGPHNS